MTSDEIKKLHRDGNNLEATIAIEVCYQLAVLNEQVSVFWGPISLDIHALIVNECEKRKIGTRYRTTQVSGQSDGGAKE